MPHILSLSLKDLSDLLKGLGKESYRAQQIFKWIYQKHVLDLDNMTNLSKSFRSEVSNLLDFQLPQVLHRSKSQDGTEKFLISAGDNKSIETVLIPSEDRLTLCLSSEVGCNLGCRFCFTAKQKLLKRLSVEEIVAQYLLVSLSLLTPSKDDHFSYSDKEVGQIEKQNRKITNIVFMGMGEPLDNLEAVCKSVEVLTSDWGFNVSKKRITVSTSGLVPHIPRIAQLGVRLAVSLNATTEDVRSKIMPINRKYSMAQLLEACKEYTQATKDKVTFEYVLLKGVTDSLEDAIRLRKLTKNIPCKINIIPFNEHPQSGFERPSDTAILNFQRKLIELGAHVLLRKTMGRDIYAACGQLQGRLQKTTDLRLTL